MKRLFAIFTALMVSTVALHAAGTELIDFSSKSQLIAKDGLLGGDVTVENFPLPVVTNAGSAFDHSKSTVVERVVSTVDVTGHPFYQTASLTYNLGVNAFTVPNTPATEAIVLWVHVDGPVVNNPGPGPFNGKETRPWVIELQFFTEGNKFFVAPRRRCARGWNELIFPLSTFVPTPHCPDPGLNRRITHLNSAGSTGTTVSRIKIRVLGTNDSSEAYVVNKVRLNSCTKQAIKGPCPVILMYDDGWNGVKRYAKDLIDQYNMKATLSIIGQYYAGVLDPNHMTREDIDALYNDNARFDLVNHTYSHDNLHNTTSPLSFTAVYNNIKNGMDALAQVNRNNGNKFLSYPGGMSDAQVYTVMDQLGIVVGRVNSPEWDPNGNTDLLQNPYCLGGYLTCSAEHGVDGYNSNFSIEQFEDWIDEGIAEGVPRIVILHDVLPPDDPGIPTRNVRNWNTVQWHEQALTYLHSLGSAVTFKTLPQWYYSLDPLHKARGIRY